MEDTKVQTLNEKIRLARARQKRLDELSAEAREKGEKKYIITEILDSSYHKFLAIVRLVDDPAKTKYACEFSTHSCEILSDGDRIYDYYEVDCNNEKLNRVTEVKHYSTEAIISIYDLKLEELIEE